MHCWHSGDLPITFAACMGCCMRSCPLSRCMRTWIGYVCTHVHARQRSDQYSNKCVAMAQRCVIGLGAGQRAVLCAVLHLLQQPAAPLPGGMSVPLLSLQLTPHRLETSLQNIKLTGASGALRAALQKAPELVACCESRQILVKLSTIPVQLQLQPNHGARRAVRGVRVQAGAPSAPTNFAAGVAAAVAATLLTQPADMLRTHMQARARA